MVLEEAGRRASSKYESVEVTSQRPWPWHPDRVVLLTSLRLYTFPDLSPNTTMLVLALMLLSLVSSIHKVDAFSVRTTVFSTLTQSRNHPSSIKISPQLHARGNKVDDTEDEEDDRELVPVGRRYGRRGREEGGYYDDRQATTSGSSRRYQDNVEFFDLDDDDEDDDDIFEDEFDTQRGSGEEIYNGIIPNPLLDAMDPDGVYERLGPELFRDWTFYRDLALFVAFLAFFTGDTHRYGTFDSVVEGLERLPADFIK